ncbi:unnamed protein product [Anisakis simplex]|uniref:E3 ubiquitin-protein ligase n=1 Tax=Anisakis simplex TaxID=6269 RepID=A0A0M3IYB5_ANISI|nr:unnamed protein product [Anisakis simplex]
MPPGDSLNEYGSAHSSDLSSNSDLDTKMEEQDWETKIMEEARFFKEMCDELKAAGCPLFGGRYCERLSPENREKAAVLEDRLDALLGFDTASVSSFRTRTRDELRLFIAQGDTLTSFKEKSHFSRIFPEKHESFVVRMKQYDFSLKCNAVWSSDAIAYRCNTCAYNPCMSLCADCFQNSNHQGHDFNRFFSQAGGACDCGNSDVLRESGFCARHGPNAVRPPAPSDKIVSLAEFVIPKLFVRLFLYFRGWNRRYEELVEQKKQRSSDVNKETFSCHLIAQAHILIEFLQEIVDCGGPIRDAVADILLNKQLYAELNKRMAKDDLEEKSKRVDVSLDWRTRSLLEEDLKSLKTVEGAPERNYSFECLLDELVFWMIRLIFPQSIINLCLSMLSHAQYRDWFARQFFSLYGCIAEIMVDLAKSEGNATIYAVSSRVIHISVQILSSEAMCNKLDDEISLKYLLISSTRGLLSAGLQRSYLTQAREYFYESTAPSADSTASTFEPFTWIVFSVDLNQPLRKHSYWTLVSDMQNLLGHPSIARKFFRDSASFSCYAKMIALMQGMNVNFRVVCGDHVEYDTAQPYQLSFHLEWEVAAVNMFNTLNALTDEIDCMNLYLLKWKSLMQSWLEALQMTNMDVCAQPYCVSYHIPLHRHIAAGVMHSVEHLLLREPVQGLLAEDEQFLRRIALHPLRIQVCRAETSAGMWARNGNAARNQSFYYAQTNYNTALLDCDIALLRFIASNVHPEWFLNALSASFYLDECFSYSPNVKYTNASIADVKPIVITRKEWVDSLIDGALRLLLELIVIAWNTNGVEEKDVEREIVAALAIGDLTHSKLKSAIPEKGSRAMMSDKAFDSLLQKGVFRLSEQSWYERFDPVFCRMRATTAREFNDALLRSENIERTRLNRSSPGSGQKMYGCGMGGHFWIPYRLISFDGYADTILHLRNVFKLLVSPTFFEILFEVLAMHIDEGQISDSIVQQVVYLLTLSVSYITSPQFKSASDDEQCFWTRNETLTTRMAITRSAYHRVDHNISAASLDKQRTHALSLFTLNVNEGDANKLVTCF